MTIFWRAIFHSSAISTQKIFHSFLTSSQKQRENVSSLPIQETGMHLRIQDEWSTRFKTISIAEAMQVNVLHFNLQLRVVWSKGLFYHLFSILLQNMSLGMSQKSEKNKNCYASDYANVKGEGKCSSYLFLTSAMDRGKWSASSSGRPLPQEAPRYTLDRKLGGPQN